MKADELINDSIVKTYEENEPKLCAIIKEMVDRGAKYNDFMAFIAMKFGKQWQASLTATASLTLFKHYENRRTKTTN